ncbi:hypothetical protein QT972_01305 [Microcoleus sp. herbarium7]|uniref:hypothetical protein n=1 Tax=Microcoleus sp. herbarium7 TaxID=3055435 RepID=UPI002FD1CDA8
MTADDGRLTRMDADRREIFKVGMGDRKLPDIFGFWYCNLAGFHILYHHGNLWQHIS